MYADLVGEGWDDPQEIREEWKPIGEKKYRPIDGVIMVTSRDEDKMIKEVERVKKRFQEEPGSDTYIKDAVIEFCWTREGKTRDHGKEQ